MSVSCHIDKVNYPGSFHCKQRQRSENDTTIFALEEVTVDSYRCGLGGHLGGDVTPSKAERTLDSISHVTTEIKIFCGTMGSRGELENSKRQDNASGLVFLEPGR